MCVAQDTCERHRKLQVPTHSILFPGHPRDNNFLLLLFMNYRHSAEEGLRRRRAAAAASTYIRTSRRHHGTQPKVRYIQGTSSCLTSPRTKFPRDQRGPPALYNRDAHAACFRLYCVGLLLAADRSILHLSPPEFTLLCFVP